ncbi:3-deoxy-manno-octulosonate cytidylyltransferase [Pyrinomonas methylaliphatogenes]|nr:3-deoxy-manno-octulosonate cytidylyltransferase [Pyrinomonas methylaliphatogenes]
MIPARYGSTRLPGKPLLDIAGRPMIVRVAERAASARSVERVIVATDDERVCLAVRAAGFEAVMTRAEHRSGSDRVAEVARELVDFTCIVNLQGDEPLISPQTIERAVRALIADRRAQVVTCYERIAEPGEVLDPDVVKIVIDERGYALYFSRAPIPFPRDAVQRYGSLEEALRAEPALLATFRKHTGLYAYRRDFLLEYSQERASDLECIESLEQLRALGMGARIRAIEVNAPTIGVDTFEDLMRVRAIWERGESEERINLAGGGDA